jgi:uncharacterized protein with NRDE domain
MCLVALAWNVSHRYPLVIAANRDEFHARPTLPAHEWQDAQGVFGGRDLRAGGGWLALSAKGRLAVVTNVREPMRAAGGKSRGHLVRDFVMGNESAAIEATRGHADAHEYGPFNLILWDGRELVHATNRPQSLWSALQPGVYGISNGPLDSPWPKVQRMVTGLQRWLRDSENASHEADTAALFAALADADSAPDAELPDTGVGLEAERRLAPPFIRGEEYGTRASTVVMVSHDRQATLIERSFAPLGVPTGELRIVLPIDRRFANAPTGASTEL